MRSSLYPSQLRVAAYIAALLLAPHATWAAPAIDIPGSAVPGRQLEQALPQPETNRPTPHIEPLQHKEQAPANADHIFFKLDGISIDGATALSPASFTDLWQPFVGEKISVAQLYDIAASITRRYAEAGYILSFAVIPQQKISDGQVRIHVIEGYVDQVNFTGDTSPGASIAGLADKIRAQRPLQIHDLERDLLVINDQPGLSARATFAASSSTPEASTLTVTIEHETFSLDGHIDDRLPYYLGRWNSSASATVNGLITGSDSFSVTAGCGIFCNVYHMAAGRWSSLIGNDGLKISAAVNNSYDAPAEGFLKSLSFYGRETDISVSLDYPILRSRQEILDAGVTLAGANAGTWTFAGKLTADQTRTIDIHTNYDFADSIGGSNLLHTSLIQGVPLLGATGYNDPLKSRTLGDSTFTAVQASISRLQPLAILSPSLENYSLYAIGWGQLDLAQPLLSASQCSYGGGFIGRGYDSGALSGDHCAMVLIELRRDLQLWRFTLQPYIAGDAGGVWEQGRLVAGDQRFLGAESVSAGLRLNQDGWFSSDISVAQPLRTSIAEQNQTTPRFFLTIQAHF